MKFPSRVLLLVLLAVGLCRVLAPIDGMCSCPISPTPAEPNEQDLKNVVPGGSAEPDGADGDHGISEPSGASCLQYDAHASGIGISEAEDQDPEAWPEDCEGLGDCLCEFFEWIGWIWR